MRKKVVVEAALLDQLRAAVERARAEVDAGDEREPYRFLGAAGWLSEELERTSEEVSA